MPWRGPEFEGEFPSLGPAAVEWVESLGLDVPAGEKIGQPLILADSQFSYFDNWYRIDPERERRYYRRGQDLGPKGAAKSPEGGVTCLVEAYGPCVFDGWDANGEPVGKPRPDAVVSIGGLSQGQTGNMYDWLYTMLVGSAAADEYGWTVELGRITNGSKGGYGVIEASTSSASSTGKPQTFVAMEETWLWTKSSGMHRVARGWLANVKKTGGSSCEYTNPPELGNNTWAEMTQREAAKKGRQKIMLFHRSADLPKEIRKGGIKLAKNEKLVRAAIDSAYGDTLKQNGGWMDAEDVYDGITDEGTPEDEGYRLWLGVGRDVSGRIVSPEAYDRKDRVVDRTIEPGSLVVVTFDGSKSEDSTVIMLTTLEETPFQQIHEIWERPAGPKGEGYRIPTADVDQSMMECLSTYQVVCLGADEASGWESLVMDWGVKLGRLELSRIGDPAARGLLFPVWWNTSNKLVDTMTRLYDAAWQDEATMLTHGEDETMRSHILRMNKQLIGKYLRPIKDESDDDGDTVRRQGQGVQIDAGITSIFGYWLAKRYWEQYAGLIGSGSKTSGEKSKRSSKKLDRLKNL